MVEHRSASRKLFIAFNYTFLAVMSLACLLPLLNVLSVSFSSAAAIEAGRVTLWPVDFTARAYTFVAEKKEFLTSIGISGKRVLLGVLINMTLTILTAYPLSKDVVQLKFRTGYAWVFVFTMLFSGGLIPTYMVIRQLGMLDSIWALVLPGAVPIFNVVLMLNFFRNLPKELSESAFIDGAGHWQTLWRIIVPLSMPSIATVSLFTIVGHWNEWFGGLIYMNDPIHYPLASYLQTIVVRLDMTQINDPTMLRFLSELNDRAIRAAQIFLGMLPVLCVYPFLQRFFMSGIVLGSVKE
ncbi:carbohydrate ABC transporter permease [Paenibacillus cymbidii]|uniref:carbohydrate ABC transporter permease n=1 Tax=Paenibacillus cymbidii TaxID=1639034 RepID=UPI001080ED8B|nr:carbohydrate ABC transporter permease [Paenibacillus cymbidii]